jgi:hypothetical protein
MKRHGEGRVQAAKLHASMLHREEHESKGRTGLLHKDVLPLLERSLQVFELARQALIQCPDLRFHGWAALCATEGASNAARWALVRLNISRVKGQSVLVPSSTHLVPLQVRCMCSCLLDAQ